MLTQAQVLSAVKGGREAQSIDNREFGRLVEFFPASDMDAFGYALKEDAGPWDPKPWSEEAVRAQLAEDLDFAFEKALDKRGISAHSMYEVVKMWMWVLEDDLQHCDDYAQYGLPLLKRVAVKYGLPNQIGDDDGTEHRYSTYGDD